MRYARSIVRPLHNGWEATEVSTDNNACIRKEKPHQAGKLLWD
jgi:hypothetical protein